MILLTFAPSMTVDQYAIGLMRCWDLLKMAYETTAGYIIITSLVLTCTFPQSTNLIRLVAPENKCWAIFAFLIGCVFQVLMILKLSNPSAKTFSTFSNPIVETVIYSWSVSD